ncbi:MAG: C39 family peptidase [Candidatus Gracilibacteria bacterium]
MFFAAVFLVFAFYVSAAFYIKNIGIELDTDKTWDYSQEIEYFLQTDPSWANQKLGNSDYTLAEQGCAVADIAMVLRYLGNEIDPELLNKELTKSGAYTENGNLLWYKLEELYPVEYKFKRVFGAGTVEKDLEEGILPIVRVKYGANEVEHWVLIVGADGNDFLIMDPLNEDKILTKLGGYGKVYAYRAIVEKNERAE